MRISDWSSDVCSSDLPDQVVTERSRFGEDEVRPEDRAAARDVAVDRDGLTGEADVTVDSARDRDRLSRRDDVAGDGAADRDRLARSVDIAVDIVRDVDDRVREELRAVAQLGRGRLRWRWGRRRRGRRRAGSSPGGEEADEIGRASCGARGCQYV